MARALDSGVVVCPTCHKTCKRQVNLHTCSRCGCKFYPRKKNSEQHCLAWCIAATIAFVPANLMPIMVFNTLSGASETTVLQGVETLLRYGMYPVAVVVFIASFVVPIGKIVALVVLIWGVKHSSGLTAKQRTKMFFVIEFLGPWSMLDVFVVALMAAVVSLGFLTSISAGAGLTYFTLMVIFTMFAANSFDPRLIWDKQRNEKY